ncbi:hypothetical protein EKO27_g10949, partial [Xylaria grammica]
LGKRMKDDVRKTARRELEKLGVKYIGGAKITASPTEAAGEVKGAKTITLTRADGTTETLAADLVVPTSLFILGDAGNLQPAQAANTDTQTRHLMTQLGAYFSGGPIKPYTFDPNQVQLALTIGRDRGTGQVGSWKLWSILVWFLKGRHLGTDGADAFAKGDAGGMGRAWPK